MADLKSLWPVKLLVMWSMAFAECLVTRVGLFVKESYYTRLFLQAAKDFV